MKQELKRKIIKKITNQHSLEYLNIQMQDLTNNSSCSNNNKRDNKRKNHAVDAVFVYFYFRSTL